MAWSFPAFRMPAYPPREIDVVPPPVQQAVQDRAREIDLLQPPWRDRIDDASIAASYRKQLATPAEHDKLVAEALNGLIAKP